MSSPSTPTSTPSAGALSQALPYAKALGAVALSAVLLTFHAIYAAVALATRLLAQPLVVFSPHPVLLYLLAPIFLFVTLVLEVLLWTPLRVGSHLADVLYPVYLLVGVACITGAVLGFGGRHVSMEREARAMKSLVACDRIHQFSRGVLPWRAVGRRVGHEGGQKYLKPESSPSPSLWDAGKALKLTLRHRQLWARPLPTGLTSRASFAASITLRFGCFRPSVRSGRLLTRVQCVPSVPGPKNNGQPCVRCARKGLVCEYLETAEEELRSRMGRIMPASAPASAGSSVSGRRTPAPLPTEMPAPPYPGTPRQSAPARSHTYPQVGPSVGRHWSYLPPDADLAALAAGEPFTPDISPRLSPLATQSRSRSSSLADALGSYEYPYPDFGYTQQRVEEPSAALYRMPGIDPNQELTLVCLCRQTPCVCGFGL
uniref:Zn(2)-C6 fungal-type domain-containing protein n=1 Tax=Mycena chlorophos TaxID=658473 RepID=A0ABQ0LWG2_MYCCL|nr:predicted protein [Mycena chlorophos]